MFFQKKKKSIASAASLWDKMMDLTAEQSSQTLYDFGASASLALGPSPDLKGRNLTNNALQFHTTPPQGLCVHINLGPSEKGKANDQVQLLSQPATLWVLSRWPAMSPLSHVRPNPHTVGPDIVPAEEEGSDTGRWKGRCAHLPPTPQVQGYAWGNQ